MMECKHFCYIINYNSLIKIAICVPTVGKQLLFQSVFYIPRAEEYASEAYGYLLTLTFQMLKNNNLYHLPCIY
jgi:hypothetical protein